MYLSNEQIQELKDQVAKRLLLFPMERKGQAYFNVLYILYPEIADNIRGTEYDPFYVNEKIDKFLDYISII